MPIKRTIVFFILTSILIATTSCNKTPSSKGSETSTIDIPSMNESDNSNVVDSESSEDAASIVAGSSTSKNNGVSKTQTANSSKTTNQDKKENYILKVSDFILDESVFATRYLNKGFEAYSDYGRHGCNKYLSKAAVQINIEKQKLGCLNYLPFDGPHGMVGEWGYSFLNLDGHWAGDGLLIEGCGWIKNKPADDKEAVAIMKNWIFKQYAGAPYNIKYGIAGMGSMNGHTLFEHYAGEWGFDYIGAEIGENIAAHQAHMAFTRGAARQYGKIGIMYFSNWNYGTIGTWEQYPTWPQGDKNGGHSMSLLKRSYMMSYMGGASSFTFEAGANLAFFGPENVSEDGLYELTPYGKTMQELVAFSTKNPDIGINYTPLGVVLDYYHGMGLFSTLESGSGIRRDKSFAYFPNTAGDDMKWNFFRILYPNAGFFNYNDYYSGAPEETHQVNSPYGDTSDVILQNASQKVLNSYPCLILVGDIKLSSAEKKRYVEYVKQGGTLILNKAYLPYFSSYKNSYTGGTRQDIKDGKGTVIVYGPDYNVENLDNILLDQLAKFIPFSFSKDVEYLVNVKNGSLIVTVINNNGVHKENNQAPVIDQTKKMDLTIKYTGDLKIRQVKELYYETQEKVSGNAVKTTIGPGEYKVFEFIFG